MSTDTVNATADLQEIGFHSVGSMRIAETPTRVDEFKYQMTRGQWQDIPMELIGPERVRELHPLLDMDYVSACSLCPL